MRRQVIEQKFREIERIFSSKTGTRERQGIKKGLRNTVPLIRHLPPTRSNELVSDSRFPTVALISIVREAKNQTSHEVPARLR